MLFMTNPSQAVHSGVYSMRILPRLTIDRILFFSVLLSAVYFVLYGTRRLDEERQKEVQIGVVPGDAFLVTNDDSLPPNNPEHRQSLSQHLVRRDIRFPDILGYPVQGANLPTCPNKVRLKALRENCKNSPIRNYRYSQGPKEHLRNVVLDHDRKLFYCLIGKAGSRSWLYYLVKTKDASQDGHLRHNSFLKRVGLEMYRNMPLDLAENEYKDYFKYLVVRHPLQRTVSAYYETVMKHRKYRNERGKPLNFTEYVEAITGHLMDLNPHWRRYINRCLVCKVDYDYIVKTETMDDDMRGFSKVIGIDKEEVAIGMSHENPFLNEEEQEEMENKNSHRYKYDKLLYDLQRKSPELMKDLINVYGEDMHLFGYKWDWWRGKSACGAEYDGRECC